MTLGMRNIIITTIVAFAAIGFAGWRLKLSNEISNMLPMQDKVVHDYFSVADHFKTLESVYIDVDGESLGEDDIERMYATADKLYEAMDSSGRFSRIHYQINETQFLEFMTNVQRAQPGLLSVSDWETFEQRLTEDEIRRYLTRAKRSITRSLMPVEQKRVRSDPFDLTGLSMGGFESIANQNQGARIEDGRIVSANGRHILLFAVPKFPPSDMGKSRELVEFLEALKEDLRTSERDVRIGFAGGHFAFTDNAMIIRRDLGRTIPAMVLGILLLSALFFRRKFAFLLILAPVVFGSAVGLGMFALLSPSVPGLVIGCAALLIGISVDYGIHILYHLDQSDSKKVEDITPARFPTLVGAATTIAAFMSLQFSNIEGQRGMGLLAALGIAGSAFYALTCLPVLASFVPSSGHRRLDLSAMTSRIQDWSNRNWILVMGILLFGSILSMTGLGRLEFDGDFENMNYLRPDHKKDDQHVQEIWRKEIPSSVVLRGEALEQALEKNDALAELMRTLQADGLVNDVLSLASVLPSPKTQEARWDRWENFWTEDRIDSLRSETNTIAGELGFASSALSPFFDRLVSERSLLDLEDYTDSGIYSLVSSRLSESEGHVFVQTSFIAPDVETFQEVRAAVEKAFPDAVVMNGKWFADHSRRLVSAEMIRLALVASTVVVMCLVAFFGSIELMMAVLAPVMFGLLLTLGVLGWIGLSINLVSSLFIVFVLGVGVDFNIFLFNAHLDIYRQRDSDTAATGSAVVLCALTTLFGFGSLTLAQHPAIFSMGVTGFVGIASCLLASFLITPLMVRLVIPQEGRYGVGTLFSIGRATWAFSSLFGQATFYVFVLKPIWYLEYQNDLLARQRKVRRFMGWIFRVHLSTFPWKSCASVYYGAETKELEKPCVLVSNHQSLFDAPMLLTVPWDMVMVVRRDLLRWPIFGTLLRDGGYIGAVPNDHETTLAKCEAALNDGVSVLFFPEGSRSHSPDVGRLRTGAFELAIRKEFDVVPVLLSNTISCIHGHGFATDRYSCSVRALPRITSDNFDYTLSARDFAKEVRRRMREHVNADFRVAQQHPTFWSRVKMHYGYQGAKHRHEAFRGIRGDRLLRNIDSLVPETAGVIVPGAGIGLFANVLARLSLERQVLGTDVDDSKLRVARSASQNCNNLSFECTESFGTIEGQWQAAILVDQLGPLDESKRRSMLNSVSGLLDADGIIVFRESGASEEFRTVLESCGLRIRSEHKEFAKGDEIVWTLEKSEV